METIFSHIVQKRFSQYYEDIATDALAYLLKTSESANRGMNKLLRSIIPDLPELRFITQKSEESIRPDMWGYTSDNEPIVYMENKFWAGLTDNQPVSYLDQLSKIQQPTLLLFVAPAARKQTLWRELKRRLDSEGITLSQNIDSENSVLAVTTNLGPVLALTTWHQVLSVIDQESIDDPVIQRDLIQLRSLCNAADINAFKPFTLQEITDQRSPQLIIQLGSVVEEAIDLSVTENILDINGLRPQASYERMGRYAQFGTEKNRIAGTWIGVHFDLWKKYGNTPIWMLFRDTNWGRAAEVRALFEPIAIENEILTADVNNSYAIALDLPINEEKSLVVRYIVDQVEKIAAALSNLPQRADSNQPDSEITESN